MYHLYLARWQDFSWPLIEVHDAALHRWRNLVSQSNQFYPSSVDLRSRNISDGNVSWHRCDIPGQLLLVGIDLGVSSCGKEWFPALLHYSPQFFKAHLISLIVQSF